MIYFFFKLITVGFFFIVTLPVLFPRAAQCEGRSLRRVTSVTHARGVFIWWKGFVQRGSTSTGSVFAVLPAAVPCDRERMPLTLNMVRIIKGFDSIGSIYY